jgi:site-specific recombinase XerD
LWLMYRALGTSPGSTAASAGRLRAEDKSERTVKSYTEAARLFAAFLAGRGHPLEVDAITRDDVRAFIADRRNAAILRLFLDTGIRVSEAAGIILPDDLDLDDQVVIVLGKGRRPRAVPFGRKTALALDRYLWMRASHPFAHLPNLWLGLAGAMTPSGLYQAVAAEGRTAFLAARGTSTLRSPHCRGGPDRHLPADEHGYH